MTELNKYKYICKIKLSFYVYTANFSLGTVIGSKDYQIWRFQRIGRLWLVSIG